MRRRIIDCLLALSVAILSGFSYYMPQEDCIWDYQYKNDCQKTDGKCTGCSDVFGVSGCDTPDITKYSQFRVWEVNSTQVQTNLKKDANSTAVQCTRKYQCLSGIQIHKKCNMEDTSCIALVPGVDPDTECHLCYEGPALENWTTYNVFGMEKCKNSTKNVPTTLDPEPN